MYDDTEAVNIPLAPNTGTQAAQRARRHSARAHVTSLWDNAKVIISEEEHRHEMYQLTTTSGHIGLPLLDNDNYAIWLYTIRAFAEEHDLAEHLGKDVEIPKNGDASKLAKKRKSQAGRLIVSTNNNQMLQRLGEDINTKTPSGMMMRSKSTFRQKYRWRSMKDCTGKRSIPVSEKTSAWKRT